MAMLAPSTTTDSPATNTSAPRPAIAYLRLRKEKLRLPAIGGQELDERVGYPDGSVSPDDDDFIGFAIRQPNRIRVRPQQEVRKNEEPRGLRCCSVQLCRERSHLRKRPKPNFMLVRLRSVHAVDRPEIRGEVIRQA